jgi:hypothetical protein
MTGDTLPEHDDELARLDRLFTEALRVDAAPRRLTSPAKSAIAVPLAEACRLSRGRGLPPEQVIILLKGTWGRLRDTSYETLDEAHDALDRAVSACIVQYFAEHATSPEDGGVKR